MATTSNNDAHIPCSNHVVSVSVIDTSTLVTGPASNFLRPSRPSHDLLKSPSLAFLIQHLELGRNVLFDLGLRKDWRSLPPAVIEKIGELEFRPEVERDVRQMLEENGFDASAENMEAVIWSHAHFDHVGDMSRFDAGTKLVVGPGTKDALLPGYPSDPDSLVLESDFAGRQVDEISFTDSAISVGQFPAVDYFGDGSLYLLDAPGHMVGHLCALARLTCQPDSFILLAGDAVHHGGDFRPSARMPLPAKLSPEISTGLPRHSRDAVESLLAGRDPAESFYHLDDQVPCHDLDAAKATKDKLQEMDAAQHVLVAFAHDENLTEIIHVFPKTANEAFARGWKGRAHWLFLRDFIP